MRLDFHHTCPDIDKNIRIINDELEKYFINLLEELSPLTPEQTIRDYAQNYSEEVYSQIIEEAIESVRSTNEKMRESADIQIERLTNEIDNLKYEIKDLNKQF